MELLYHFTVDIVRNGGFVICDAGIYDYFHSIFNHSYAKKSKRRTTAMKDSIAIVGHRIR